MFMANETVLAKIREAETKAEKILADAESKKQKLIEDAQKKAISMQSEAADEIKNDSELELKKTYDALRKKKEKIISDCGKDVNELRKSGEKKLPKAVDLLFGAFTDGLEK